MSGESELSERGVDVAWAIQSSKVSWHKRVGLEMVAWLAGEGDCRKGSGGSWLMTMNFKGVGRFRRFCEEIYLGIGL